MVRGTEARQPVYEDGDWLGWGWPGGEAGAAAGPGGSTVVVVSTMRGAICQQQVCDCT